MPAFFIISLCSMFFLLSCSSISKKDCMKDMMTFGISQGRAGSPKKYTDDLRSACSDKNPSIDLESYEKGFYQGWAEYCVPSKAFDMGKRSDRYISFCPADRESLFRERYLIGKHHSELKDVETDISDKLSEMKPTMNQSAGNFDDYTKLEKELEKVRRDIQALEVQALKAPVKFR